MPPSDDRRDSPALRQEGPQQELLTDLYALVDTLAPASVIRDLLVNRRRALSASRTAQAPQQEGVDLEPIKVRESVATRGPWTPYDNHILLPSVGAVEFVTDNPHAGDSSADTHFIAHARTDIPALIAEIERHRARIQVLETSVDYLRYLVDHPVTQWLPIATAPTGEVLLYRPQMPPLERIAVRRANDWCGEKCCRSARPTHWIPIPDPPVAPAEGEQ